MIYANVYLFTESDDEGNHNALQYELTPEQLESLHYAVEQNLTLIPFGDYFHHSDDIIKFNIVKSTDKPYTNM